MIFIYEVRKLVHFEEERMRTPFPLLKADETHRNGIRRIMDGIANHIPAKTH